MSHRSIDAGWNVFADPIFAKENLTKAVQIATVRKTWDFDFAEGSTLHEKFTNFFTGMLAHERHRLEYVLRLGRLDRQWVVIPCYLTSRLIQVYNSLCIKPSEMIYYTKEPINDAFLIGKLYGWQSVYESVWMPDDKVLIGHGDELLDGKNYVAISLLKHNAPLVRSDL